MAAKPIDEHQRHDVVLLARQGMSVRAISRALSMSRKTVKKLLEQQEEQRETPHMQLKSRPERSPISATYVQMPPWPVS